jgi:hypothetical protein
MNLQYDSQASGLARPQERKMDTNTGETAFETLKVSKEGTVLFVDIAFPTPIAAKADPMPPHQRLRLNDRDDPQNRRKPSIQLDKKPAIIVRQPNPARHLSSQNHQLVSKCCILSFEPDPRLEW